ncbi:MAG: TRAP transporter small permease [Beijerinckiaceae bacterium]
MLRLTRIFALAGGFIVFALAALVTASVVLRWWTGLPVSGDFEIVQMGTALAVFCFLPYCQARRGNIVVDTFTAWLSEGARARIDAVWDALYALTMGVIGYAMLPGVAAAWKSGEETMVARIPLWPALAVSTALVLLLALTSIWTARRLWRGVQ